MKIEFAPRVKFLITQITWITEHIRIVLRLHMVPCAGDHTVRESVTQGGGGGGGGGGAGDHTVRESVTQGAVELLIIRILPHKLQKITWVL